ncbi:hypothetical protein Ancab_019636 [Ancistrocladus abbreviatus]
MEVKAYSQEIESPVAAARLFKAFCLDNHNVFPSLMPEFFKSIEFVKGTSVAVGSVRQFNFSDGYQYKNAKNKIDELDLANFYCKSTTAGGDMVDGKYECLVIETKLYPKGSGCVCKMTIHVHPMPGTEFNKEVPKMGQEQMKKMFKTVEAYLIANPGAYA